MADITDKYKYVQERIPDPQVVDVADQFYDAAEVLWGKSPGDGVIIPTIINSVLAIELYLKSLCSYSIIKDYHIYEDGVCGGVVTVEPKKAIHNLSDLLNIIEDSTKEKLLQLYDLSSLATDESSLYDLLKKFDQTFVKVRYVYEDSSFFSTLNLKQLRTLMIFMKDFIKSIPEKVFVLK